MDRPSKGLFISGLAASRDTASRLLFVVIVTTGIGFGPFHHCLLGTTEVLSAMFMGKGVTLGEFGHFPVWTTPGNAVGGTVFVALSEEYRTRRDDADEGDATDDG
ncbi:formate/nitrite transporter family protein [Haladaptatus salinisoli]|uniref:formate/nitrite transporter family protein n=1 Tax=Haladaptatus salinisoli TaxID=2884876 RepID=UPI001D0A4938|nr:formate/nitrite transporter family protein [Haladaptatus salinisoli]